MGLCSCLFLIAVISVHRVIRFFGEIEESKGMVGVKKNSAQQDLTFVNRQEQVFFLLAVLLLKEIKRKFI